MSSELLYDANDPAWVLVGRFSEMSTLDGKRELLEAIPDFMTAQDAGNIPENGLPMPDVDSIRLGNIVAITYVADTPICNDRVVDGLVAVKRALATLE